MQLALQDLPSKATYLESKNAEVVQSRSRQVSKLTSVERMTVKGFALYVDQYPLNKKTKAFIETPFLAGENPLDFDL